MPMRFVRALSALPLLLVALNASGAEPAAAQALFNEGKQLMGAGRYAEACPKLEESQRLDPGMGTLFHLAECDEHVGKTATAWAAYLEVAAQAKMAAQPAREKVARERAAALEPKLGHLAITAPPAAAPGGEAIDGLELRRDGILIGKAQWGASLPVDPGDHVVVANAPGRRSWQASVRVEPAKAQTIAIPRLEPAPVTTPEVAAAPVPVATAPAAPVAIPPATRVGETPAPEPPAGERLGPQKIAAVVIGGLGVVGLGLGTYFGLSSKSKHDDAGAHCAGNACDAEGVSLRSDAITAGNASTVAFALGAAALAGGAVVWLTAPPASHESARVGVSPGAGGVIVRGAF
jgi:hypothetical protein